MRASTFDPPTTADVPAVVSAFVRARSEWMAVAFKPWDAFEKRFEGPQGRCYVEAYAALKEAVVEHGGEIMVDDVTYRIDKHGGVEIHRVFPADNMPYEPRGAGARGEER